MPKNSNTYTPPLTSSPADIKSHLLKLVCNNYNVPFDSGLQEKMLDYHWKNNYDKVVMRIKRRRAPYYQHLEDNGNFLTILQDEIEELLEKEMEHLEKGYYGEEEPIYDLSELRWRIHRKIMKYLFQSESSSGTGIDCRVVYMELVRDDGDLERVDLFVDNAIAYEEELKNVYLIPQ